MGDPCRGAVLRNPRQHLRGLLPGPLRESIATTTYGLEQPWYSQCLPRHLLVGRHVGMISRCYLLLRAGRVSRPLDHPPRCRDDAQLRAHASPDGARSHVMTHPPAGHAAGNVRTNDAHRPVVARRIRPLGRSHLRPLNGFHPRTDMQGRVDARQTERRSSDRPGRLNRCHSRYVSTDVSSRTRQRELPPAGARAGVTTASIPV